jgi:hypothetical protein
MASTDLHDLGPASYTWSAAGKKADFLGRDGCGALVFNDTMFLIGGWNPCDPAHFPRHCVNDVWTSTDGENWTCIKENSFTVAFDCRNGWEGTHTAGYVVYQDRMWIIGGDPLQGHYQCEVWNSEDGVNWTHVNDGVPMPWAPRVLHYTFALNNALYIIGGQTLPQHAPAPEAFYHDIWRSRDGVHWEEVHMQTPFTPQRGLICGTAVFQDRVWLIGGGKYPTLELDHYVYENDVWSSSDGVHWECHTVNAPWTGKVYHNVVVFDDRLWIIGGQSKTGNTNDVWYSSDGTNWYEIDDAPWQKRHAASLFDYNGRLWMVGGCHLDNDIFFLEKS